MRSLAFGLLAVSTLFVIVDPVAAVPAFLAMTPNDTAERRICTARLACWVTAAGLLLVFAVLGTWVFRALGITMPAFQLAASVILLLIALDMLRAQRSRVQETREETDAGAAKEDVAVTPLAVPMLAGPGAISTAILLHNGVVDPLGGLPGREGYLELLLFDARAVAAAARGETP
jgi:multiple antibiotic resistance protein